MSLMAYDSYRKSNLEWLDEVPDHWEHKKIAWDLPYVVGWTPPSGKDEFYDGEHPWVTIADMTRGNIEDTQSKITDAAIEAKKAEIVPAGSMLFSFKLSVGKVAFLKIDSYTNEAIAAFRPTSGISLEFWKYAAPEIIPHYGRENIYGAKLLNQELIGSARFYCPPVEEQAQIARFLDHETAKIDALIREQERLIELLQEKRQAVISHAVTKGLDPDVPMKDSGVEWLGEVPAHWEVSRVGWLLTDLTYGFTNPMPTEDDGPKMLTANDIGWGTVLYETARSTSVSAFKELLTDKSRPRKGDVLLTKDGTLGRVALHDGRPACINQSVALLRPYEKRLSPRFLVTLLQASSYQRKMIFDAGGTTIKHIYITRLSHMPLALPPTSEQISIVEATQSLDCRYKKLIDTGLKTISLLTERRSALISAAVTGKIDVRNWQPPADESAFDEEVRKVGMETTA